ncbi:hypothetical protein Q31b_34160 [Novipirellula aureliae]|uniref:Uncharacterized protein n=1 Tax=Novipirellula aureliae TaxID=2527966 RepID=A0A5C6DTQ8_9BACT|nr:hypothetical protein [Novipirellula aureliae]TWU40072.1 hypothetical protein Q31b_34160 [Novipirellula aureliae]
MSSDLYNTVHKQRQKDTVDDEEQMIKWLTRAFVIWLLVCTLPLMTMVIISHFYPGFLAGQ